MISPEVWLPPYTPFDHPLSPQNFFTFHGNHEGGSQKPGFREISVKKKSQILVLSNKGPVSL